MLPRALQCLLGLGKECLQGVSACICLNDTCTQYIHNAVQDLASHATLWNALHVPWTSTFGVACSASWAERSASDCRSCRAAANALLSCSDMSFSVCRNDRRALGVALSRTRPTTLTIQAPEALLALQSPRTHIQGLRKCQQPEEGASRRSPPSSTWNCSCRSFLSCSNSLFASSSRLCMTSSFACMRHHGS